LGGGGGKKKWAKAKKKDLQVIKAKSPYLSGERVTGRVDLLLVVWGGLLQGKTKRTRRNSSRMTVPNTEDIILRGDRKIGKENRGKGSCCNSKPRKKINYPQEKTGGGGGGGGASGFGPKPRTGKEIPNLRLKEKLCHCPYMAK